MWRLLREYSANIQRKKASNVLQIGPKLWQSVRQIFPSSSPGSPNNRRNFEHLQNFGEAFGEHGRGERLMKTLGIFDGYFGNSSNLAFANVAK